MTEVPIDIVDMSIGLIGGLALFLYGMHTMSEGLTAAAGDGMKTLLARLTTNRFTGAMTGATVTAVIQSSSVTTVLVVGFISAGIMTLSQSVGVIMGANIGTTVTAQIVAFKVTKYAWAMLAAGFGFWAFPRSKVVRQYGAMILGLGLLFLGMDQMSTATTPLRTFEPFITLMAQTDNPFVGILLGAVFTALVQSSSATTGIVIMLASQGFLSLEGGIAIAIGANVGTCATAGLSAIGKSPDAVRAAAVHVLFNLIGALLWFGFIDQLADFARSFSPQASGLAGTARLAAETPRQIANANTLFNVANTVLLIGFTTPIARLAVKLVPDRRPAPPPMAEPEFLDRVYLRTPSIGVDRVRLELGHMAEYVARMAKATPGAWNSGSREQLLQLAEMDEDVDRLHRATLEYVQALGREELTKNDSRRLEKLLSISNYLEGTADLVGTEIVAQGLRRIETHGSVTPYLSEFSADLWAAVSTSLDEVRLALAEDDGVEKARDVIERKTAIHDMTDEVMRQLAELTRRGLIDPESFRIRSDLVSHVKRLYYNLRKISQILVQLSEPE